MPADGEAIADIGCPWSETEIGGALKQARMALFSNLPSRFPSLRVCMPLNVGRGRTGCWAWDARR